jgi:hypothetical protein|tara:strand:+ start:1341 stop:2066 length:726 start_codon:yes stop_codon:yes gene_type:complete
MAEENQVEQTTQPDVSRETTETKTEEVKEVNNNTFSEDDVNNIVKQRLAKERASIYKKLDVDDLDTAINAVKQSREAEEKEKIKKGEFEQILKEKSEEYGKKINSLESELKDIKINRALLQSASKNRAINPEQVVSLLQNNMRLNDTGNVEILDKNGITRYNNKGELLTTDELVSEFLTQNPHFVTASPSGSGSVSNVDRTELNKPFNLSDLDMNNPADKKKYAEYRKQRDSQPTKIVLNK